MSKAIKTLVSWCITATVPIGVLFVIGLVFGFSAQFVSTISGKSPVELNSMLFIGTVWSIIWWAIICVAVGAPISFAHLLFLGIPAFLIGWRFRAIRWWSVLVASFLIGAIPLPTFLFVRDFQWPSGFDSITSLEIILIGSSVVIVTAGILGLLGVSAGVTFWLIWRYWASPDSPAGRPLSISLDEKEQVA